MQNCCTGTVILSHGNLVAATAALSNKAFGTDTLFEIHLVCLFLSARRVAYNHEAFIFCALFTKIKYKTSKLLINLSEIVDRITTIVLHMIIIYLPCRSYCSFESARRDLGGSSLRLSIYYSNFR